MEGDEDNAKIIEILEGISHKYEIVNVRLSQHDKLIKELDSLFKKFEKLEENVQKKQEKADESRVQSHNHIKAFETHLLKIQKVIDNLSEKIVGFERNLKDHYQEYDNHQEYVQNLFLRLSGKIEEAHKEGASGEELEKVKLHHDNLKKEILHCVAEHASLLHKNSQNIVELKEKINAQEKYPSILKELLSAELQQRKKGEEKNKQQILKLEKEMKVHASELRNHTHSSIEKAKKEMVLSPESYESLQKDMNKKIELMSLDASNSVLKASVCDQQLKIIQRHIDAINQKIKLLELEK